MTCVRSCTTRSQSIHGMFVVLSYSLCETVGIDGENVRMLEVNRGRPVAEQEHEEVHGLGVVVEVAGLLVNDFVLEIS